MKNVINEIEELECRIKMYESFMLDEVDLLSNEIAYNDKCIREQLDTKLRKLDTKINVALAAIALFIVFIVVVVK